MTLYRKLREADISSWKSIYNDPQNADFRKKRPDPDKIYPGDEIWIPGNPKTSTGKKTVFVAPAEKIQVTEIYFESQVDIHYVRLAASHSDYIAPGVPANPGYQHLNPPTIYPKKNKPHWVFDPTTSKASESWPILLIRDGAASAKLANRNLLVSLSSDISFNGERIIKAESASGELVIGEQTVTFQNGKVKNDLFSFTKVPSTVDKLSGVTVKWNAKKSAAGSFIEICQTQHTIFIVDEKPLKGNLRGLDMFLFEIIEWSCSWAKGMSGKKDVLTEIWKEFYPVKSNHATGLVYWKNWKLKIDPNQTIDLAIRSKDDSDPLTRNAASCVVFDNIFINCLLLQGIKAAEIKIVPSNASTTGFDRGGIKYSCISFNASSVNGQGNNDAPPSWQSHWIADVFDSNSKWKIYDASYGAAAYDSNDPSTNNPVEVLAYEKEGVKDFSCYNFTTKKIVDLTAGSKPTEPPHLSGIVLWKP